MNTRNPLTDHTARCFRCNVVTVISYEQAVALIAAYRELHVCPACRIEVPA